MRLHSAVLCMLLLMASVQAQFFDDQKFATVQPLVEQEEPPRKSEVLWTKEDNQQVPVGTRWSMMIYAVDEKFEIDFSINDNSSVLLISFMFDEGEISINSLRDDRWDCLSGDRHMSPVGTKEKFFMDVTLEERGFHIVIDEYWHEFYYHKQNIDDLQDVSAYGEAMVMLWMDDDRKDTQHEEEEGHPQDNEHSDQAKDDGHEEIAGEEKHKGKDDEEEGDTEFADALSDKDETLLKSMLAEVQQKVDAQYGRETLDGVETENVVVDRVLLEDLIAYFKNDQKEEERGNGNYKDGYYNKYGMENDVK